jgi:hypothetical protein
VIAVSHDRFFFWRGYYDAMSYLDDEEAGMLFRAICAYAFDGVEPVVVGGVECYPAEALELYSREMLERMIEGERDNDEPIDIEDFFNNLEWAYPETYLMEMAA